ncbi:hypothetical protein Daesc_004765 [Daldinia eschscholtzii]|uniref:Uncharacterized protein n=1 Tax=Daldinia eschscholtzii TaxID=292717 RepID=A0AAX6MQM1_9PEZI
MRLLTIVLASLSAVALAAPIEVSTDLVERQYRPTYKVHAALEGKVADAEKRQYRPTYKVHSELEGKEAESAEKRQYRPTYKVHAELEGKETA